MSTGHESKEKIPALLQGPDGLQEYDNPMPRWMTVTYIGTIVWGIAYLFFMPGIGVNGLHWSQKKAYDQEMADAARRYAASAPGDMNALLAKAVGHQDAIAAGRGTFLTTCAACHGAGAKGLIGPNLTDATWLYGTGKPGDIAHTISNGTAKGMPSFKNTFSPEQISQLAAFVYSLSHP